MSTIKITLQKMLERYKDVRGVNRILVLADIRAYIKAHDHRVVMQEIEALANASDCDVLLGAGMRGVLYLATVKRKAQLEGL